MNFRSLKPALCALLLATALPLTGGLAPASAAAAPSAPTALTPNGDTVSGSPTLSWARVSGATSYAVQVSKTDDFASLVTSATTVNRQWVPAGQLPTGDLHWRVRSSNASGTSPWSTADFTHDPVAGPTLTSPATGHTFQQPTEPALLTWQPVPGAASYEVQISSAADDFPVGAGTTTSTATNSALLITAPQTNRDYWWHVRAKFATNLYSAWSAETRTYRVSDLDAPVLDEPADSGDQPIQDIALDWDPVPGARAYNLRISTDINFSHVDLAVSGIQSTRYSPPTTLTNDQYYWQVQPIDTFGQASPWYPKDDPSTESANEGAWTFRRNWPDQPSPTYPVGGDTVGDPFYYQWDPAEKASHYAVQISENPTFDNILATCTTIHTTLVPQDTNCMPAAAGTYYWRVFGYDEPKGVPTEPVKATIESFSYLPDMVNLATATPAEGAEVKVPTLSWNPVPGSARYLVYITKTSNNDTVVNGASTYATSYTPRTKLTVGATYRWYVRTVTASGRAGATVAADSQKTFTVVAQDAPVASIPTQVSPADGTSFKRFPLLKWDAVDGATRYRVFMKDAAAPDFTAPTALADYTPYPEGQDDTSTYLLPATYKWFVVAYDGSTELGRSGTRTFSIASLDDVTGYRVAMSGTASENAATSCTVELPVRCQNARQSPVLRWDPVDGVGGYKIVVSRDDKFTNVYKTWYSDTNAYLPTYGIPESQTEDAYYWVVLPCKGTTGNACSVLPSDMGPDNGHAFSKLSNKVQLTSPANDPNGTARIPDEIRFDWRDYLQTNFDTSTAATTGDSVGQVGGVEATKYRIEVATDETFTKKVTSREVDQTTYTEYSSLYPEGKLYWRVRAIDDSDNLLPWSSTRVVWKKSATPVPTAPLNNAVIAPFAPLKWVPQDYADGYDIEIYKVESNQPHFQPVNKVLSTSSQQAAWTPTKPLPVRTLPYEWRVRRVDATGNKGPWSAEATDVTPPSTFRVRPRVPQLTVPAAGAYVSNVGSYFAWKPIDDAAKYRFERRLVGETSKSESVSTVALAWAPTSKIADGNYEWRVVALDNQGAEIGASAWRSVKVDSTRPTVIAKSPTGNVAYTTSFTVKFSEKVTNVTTSTYRIFLAGNPTPRTATVTPNSAGTSAVLNPSSNLTKGKTYIIRVSTGVKDPAGNSLVATSWKVVAK